MQEGEERRYRRRRKFRRRKRRIRVLLTVGFFLMILISLSLLVRNVRLKDPEESASGDEFVVEDPAGNLREETQTIVSFAQGVQGKESTDESDADADGICDALDILQNAKAYVATRPEYESRYYAGGYPDDGYGVCTDVVGYALLHAGYDLMELVAQDVKDSPASYPKAEDKRIDFRRVVNLQVYFTRHAKSLTLDVRNTEAWQPGDIVVFEGHIGIISDRKNERNVPFVIHHGRVDQDEYEEDILEEREEQIIGHYRVGE